MARDDVTFDDVTIFYDVNATTVMTVTRESAMVIRNESVPKIVINSTINLFI